MRKNTDLNALSDDDLLRRLSRLVGQSRHVTADLRIAVARAARTYPILLEMLRDGRLHLLRLACETRRRFSEGEILAKFHVRSGVVRPSRHFPIE